MYMYTRSSMSMFLGLCLMASAVQADTLEFASPLASSKLSTGQTVPITYKVHHNGMAQLMWAKVHLMTDDGYDASVGTIHTALRSDWQDSLSVSSQFTIPENLPSGKYVFHVYGSTLQPCEGSIDISVRCEGILSESLPVEIVQAPAATKLSLAPVPERKNMRFNLQPQKRTLYAGREPGKRRHDYMLQNESLDTKKMLYFFSLI